MACQVWWDGCVFDVRDEGYGGREPSSEAHVCRDEHAKRPAEGSAWKKALRPSQRREMAMKAVAQGGASIALACRTFQISETCYRYSPILSVENEEIADWLERLTANKRNWGFGLCFLYLRNVQGYGWNHKRVYPIG